MLVSFLEVANFLEELGHHNWANIVRYSPWGILEFGIEYVILRLELLGK